MKNHNLTLTIGIPAFNEQSNIGVLLKLLLKQSNQYYKLRAIIVNSDGSTDNTVHIVSDLSRSNPIIKIIDNKDRKGAAFRQNEIIQRTNSDIFILLNADIIPHGHTLIDDLVKPIIDNGVDMTSPSAEPLAPRSLLEGVLYFSVMMKNELYTRINKGNNIYTCRGAMRCLSKPVYKKLKFDRSLDEDAYSYLDCITKGRRYYYVPRAKVLYKLPDTITDHIHQSNRFLNKKTDLYKRFGTTVVKDAYKLPTSLIFSITIKYFFKNPFLFCSYIGILLYCKLHTYILFKPKDLWTISKSSKTLIHI